MISGQKGWVNKMKKFLSVLFAAAVLISVTACSNTNKDMQSGRNAANDVKDNVQQGADAVENGVQEGMGAVENGVQNGINSAEDVLQNGANALENGINQAGDIVKDGVDAVDNAADKGMDAVENGIQQGADAAGNAARSIHEGTKRAVEEGADALKNAGEYIDDSMNRDQGWVPYNNEMNNAATSDVIGGVVEAAEGGASVSFEMISGFSTKLYDTEPARVDNIKLAVSKINETLLQPGETFSFNNIVGERSVETGFKEARALWMKEAVREVGGGVCQLSTTIYQAAKQAGLPIVERHPHQKPVNYVKEGMDACVDYGVFDLSFQNDSDRVLKVKASCDGVYVYVTIEREVK